MNLAYTGQQELLRTAFGRLFSSLSSPARVRGAEPLGFDPELWSELVQAGGPGMRVAEARGGAGLGLADAVAVLELAGAHLASAPLVETVVAARILSELGDGPASAWLEKLCAEGTVVTLALKEASEHAQLIPAARTAEAILWLRGDEILLLTTFRSESAHASHPEADARRGDIRETAPRDAGADPRQGAALLGSLPHAWVRLDSGREIRLAKGPGVRDLYLGAVEEWKILTAALLNGAAGEVIRLAAAYSTERQAFDKPIGSFQGVAHPLADSATDVDGSRLMVLRAIHSIAKQPEIAAREISLSYWFAAQSAGRAAVRAMRVFGGYGMSMEYDVQLYLRRMRSWSLVLGDPHDELVRAGSDLLGETRRPVPDPGPVEIDFTWGEAAERLATELREFLRSSLTRDMRNFSYHSDDAHYPELFQALAKARFLYPEWPHSLGGRATRSSGTAACQEVFNEFDVPILVPVVTDMVGKMLLEFGSDEAKAAILPALASGQAYCSLGYTEPSGGSDVFAARSRAVREGDDWILNGQKMFTTQGHLADYALLLVRTDPGASKHRGLTLFVAPLRQSGYQSQEVKTIGGERTNVTFYADMRIPDTYRLGDVNGGARVMAAALKLEQGVGLYNVGPLKRLLAHCVAWARNEANRAEVAARAPRLHAAIGRLACHIAVADALTRRSIWASESGSSQKWYGSMSKLFGSEAWLASASELLDVMAPYTLEIGPTDPGWIELEFRRALPSTIYGGTSEIHRSIIAESALQMPRSRS
jgi:3-oxochol-4-en-24-oyl-CoA dehydrogenase